MVEADIGQGDLDPDIKTVLETVVGELLDEVSLGLCFEIHRSCKVGSLLLNELDDGTSETEYAIIDKPGVDVLGQMPSKKNYECVCPNCQRHLAASRFAPHLEKCMGMGRNSSRIASRRIANNQKHGSDDSGGEDEHDNDWNYAPESKRVRRLKKEKSSSNPRNRRLAKLRNGGSSHDAALVPGDVVVDGSETSPNFEKMTLEERKALLLTSCGVISEHTRKMCTRTGKCVQHTDEQRRQVRHLLLRQSRAHDLEDIHIDIDTFDDGESQSLRESLQWEASSNSSPADSTSTNNSVSGIAPPTTSTSTSGHATISANPKRSTASSNRPASAQGKTSGGSGKNKKPKVGGSRIVSSVTSSGSNKADGLPANLFDFS